MKRCVYCGMQVIDTTGMCPHCNASDFVKVCDKCGSDYVDGVCPTCQKANAEYQIAAENQAKRAEEQAAFDKANSGLVWKSILTFFLPFIGGYFLVKPEVKKGFQIYALVWSVAYFCIGASSGSLEGESGLVVLIVCLIFFGPVIYWLWLKLRGQRKAE